MTIVDRPGAASDPDLPWVRAALDPAAVDRCVRPLVAADDVRIARAEVVGHRAGRRCVIRYDLEASPSARREGIACSGSEAPAQSVFAKIRARGADVRTLELLRELRRRGFAPGGASPASVPEPVGAVPELHMTLQRASNGKLATTLLDGPGGLALMPAVARAIHGLHAAGVPARRSHGMEQEVGILRERLDAVSRLRPELAPRLERVLAGSLRVAETLARSSRSAGIHRDFYPDQLVVNGDQITLLDLDLYARGDPALDVGNFGGHLVEHALRLHGRPDALRGLEESFYEAYCAVAQDVTPGELDGFATLTLVRHIEISTRIPARRHLTADLVDLCESRLHLPSGALAQSATG